MAELNAYCRAKLAELPEVQFNSAPDALPYILNFSAVGVRAETMLHFLSDRSVYLSSGSACSKGRDSYVLASMGLSRERIASALRLSFSRYNTKEEIDVFAAALREGLQSLARRPL